MTEEEAEAMIDQKGNIGLAAGTGDGQKAVIGNLTSTEAKAERENKTGSQKKKVCLCEDQINIKFCKQYFPKVSKACCLSVRD